MRVQVEVVFDGEPSGGAQQVWDLLLRGRLGLNSEALMIDGFVGNRVRVGEISEYLKKKEQRGFFWESPDGGSIEFAFIAGYEISRLDLNGFVSSPEEVEEWISPLFKEPQFLQARVYDKEYDIWQNMKSVDYYEARGRDHSRLPKVCNGLPFPLGAEEIDISNNPGRWGLKLGYIECVGARMWLGERFVRRVNVDLEGLMRDELIDVDESLGLIVLRVGAGCFDSPFGVQGDAQRRLRNYIYKQK